MTKHVLKGKKRQPSWSAEELAALTQLYQVHTIEKLTPMLNQQFGNNRTYNAVQTRLHRAKIPKPTHYKSKTFTTEEQQFLSSNYKHYNAAQLTKWFSAHFDWEPSERQVKNYLYKSGHISTHSYRGAKPRHPVGTERVNDRYIQVKVAEPDVWITKQRHIYQQHHNITLTEDELIFFKNPNREDKYHVDNLMLVTRYEASLLAANKYYQLPDGLKPTLKLITELRAQVKELKD